MNKNFKLGKHGVNHKSIPFYAYNRCYSACYQFSCILWFTYLNFNIEIYKTEVAIWKEKYDIYCNDTVFL